MLALLALAMTATACTNLGLGDADCTPPERGVSASTIMTAQAVPTARYTPCLRELRLGWDDVDWFAESGRAGIAIERLDRQFLRAILTETCDISSATPADSRHLDIERYEEIEFQKAEIDITVVPSGELPLAEAQRLITDMDGIEVDDRPVRFSLDEDLDGSLAARVDRALALDQYVWIIDELDAVEGTVELRSKDASVTGRESPDEALELIEDNISDVFYRGNWYFTFEGGCITYEFDVSGRLAESVADDAEQALGFFPAFELRDLAEEAGYELR